MTFDGLNLNPFSKIKSDSGKKGFSNLPMLERKAKARLLANQYSNEQAIEAAKLGYQSQLDAFKPKETSWGDIAMGVAGSAAQAGLFDNPTGLIQDPFGTDSLYGGTTTEWNTDMPINAGSNSGWQNIFGWKG
tara:strand:+ start:161 stop:559 length:399 start_codon:yes stop_codon:yes gene_type:complete